MFIRSRMEPMSEESDKGGGGESETTPETPEKPKVEFTPEQEAEIARRLRAARKDGENDGKTAAQRAADERKRQEDEERDRQAAIARGEFDSVKQGYETKITEATSAKDSLQRERDDAMEELTSVLAERIKALDDLKDDELSAAFPRDAAPLEQLKWFRSPLTKIAMSRVAEAANVEAARTGPKHPLTPTPINTTAAQALEAEKARLRQTGKYAI